MFTFATLQSCMEACGFSHTPSAIERFERCKKYGLLFYREDLNHLELDTPFEVYYCREKGAIMYRNAFPIPIDTYLTLKLTTYSYKSMEMFYRLYYEEVPPYPWEWTEWDVYMGTHFIWVYREK